MIPNFLKLPLPEENSIAIVTSSRPMLDMVRALYYYSTQYPQLLSQPETNLHPEQQRFKSQAFVDKKNLIVLTLSPYIITTFAYKNVWVYDFDREHGTIAIRSFAEHPQAAAHESAGKSVVEFWVLAKERWIWTADPPNLDTAPEVPTSKRSTSKDRWKFH